VITISNGDNLFRGNRPYRKHGAVEVLWDANDDMNEEASSSVVEIRKTSFNTYKEHAWRLYYNVAWNNIPLQSAWDEAERRGNEEMTQDFQG
jgi:hypothetical protein